MSADETADLDALQLVCPITAELFEDPVLLVEDGHTYERSAVTAWLEKHDTSPMSGAALATKTLAHAFPPTLNFQCHHTSPAKKQMFSPRMIIPMVPSMQTSFKVLSQHSCVALPGARLAMIFLITSSRRLLA